VVGKGGEFFAVIYFVFSVVLFGGGGATEL